MKSRINNFWAWFDRSSSFLRGGAQSDVMLDDLLERLHAVDHRIYFELSTNSSPNELILTAQGDINAFEVIDATIRSAPKCDDWTFIALKPAMEFDFTFRNNGITLNATDIWFLPLTTKSDPSALGLRLGIPNADAVFGSQTVDAAYTILDTGIGERSTAMDIQHVVVDDLPENPEGDGYHRLRELPGFIALRKSKHSA